MVVLVLLVLLVMEGGAPGAGESSPGADPLPGRVSSGCTMAQVIILEGCRVELAEEETEVFAFKIMFHGDGKVMIFFLCYFLAGWWADVQPGHADHGGPGGLDEADRLRLLRLHEAHGRRAPAATRRGHNRV